MIDQLFSGLRNFSLPEIGVPGTGIVVDPSLDVALDEPGLVAPPWDLSGRAVLELAQYPVEAVRPFVPREIDILQTWPGYTLGTVLFIAYERSPVGLYNELAFAPALVRYRGVVSMWVTALDVDSETSRRNGRYQWGLPKQLRTLDYGWQADRADFSLGESELPSQVSATATPALLGDLNLPEWLSGLRDALRDLSVPLQLPELSLITYKGGFVRSSARFEGGATPVRLDISASADSESPYGLLGRRQPLVGLRFERLGLHPGTPTPILPAD